MKPISPIVLGLIILFPLTATAKNPPVPIECGKTPGFQVEAEIEKTDITVVLVTFIGKKPSNEQAQKALRNCLDVAIKRDASKDILPTAWLRKKPGANKYDDEMLKPFGAGKYLSYKAATKKITVK